MKQINNIIKKILQHKFISASFWIFISTGVVNIGSYLFHLVMARMLGVEQYGVLESAISFLYILYVPLITITFVVIKFTSEYKGKNELDKISTFYLYMRKKTFLLGGIVALLLIGFSSFIISFLHLNSNAYIALFAIGFIASAVVALGRSILQGLSLFSDYAISSIVETIGKLGFAILLVYLGFKAEGAFIAIILAAIAAYLSMVLAVRKIPTGKIPFSDGKKILQYALPVFVATLSITSFYTTDILLVRHFFSGVDSGYYAALSVLGKIISYAVAPVILVMFPLVSENHAKGDRYSHYFLLSLGLTLIGSLVILSVYLLFPTLIIQLLFGKNYTVIAPSLWLFGVFITLYSLVNLLANFYLSIHKTKVAWAMAFVAILQIILISFFHSSIAQVIQCSIASMFLLVVGFLLYYPRATRTTI